MLFDFNKQPSDDQYEENGQSSKDRTHHLHFVTRNVCNKNQSLEFFFSFSGFGCLANRLKKGLLL